MKIALHTDLFRKNSIEEVVSFVVEAGYEYIELNAIPYWTPHINFFDDFREQTKTLKKLLTDNNIKLAAVSTNTDLAILDRQERMRNVKYCINAIEMCKEFDCHTICTTFSGNVLLSSQRQKTALGESLKEISNAGRENGVDIAIEIHPGSFVDSTLRAINMLKSFNLPNVGYLFCCPHIAAYGGENLEQALKVAKDYIIHFHIANTPLSMHDHKHLAPENGEINFKELIPKIKQTGYNGFLTLEIYSEAEHPVESAISSRKLLEQLINGA